MQYTPEKPRASPRSNRSAERDLRQVIGRTRYSESRETQHAADLLLRKSFPFDLRQIKRDMR